MRSEPQLRQQLEKVRPTRLGSCGKVDEIIGSFNTWAFKREQPSNMALLRQVVGNAVADQEPVPFILYWGKGPRVKAAVMEARCLEYLASLGNRVQQTYAPGARFELLLTDSHARLNGYADHDIDTYYDSITRSAAQFGFSCRRLTDVTASAPAAIYGETLERPDPLLLSSLTLSAAKWYRGPDVAAVAAERYFALNMVERRAVAHAFASSIFITFNNSQFRELFPRDLPVFYMYSVKKGVAVKPWFMDDGSAAA